MKFTIFNSILISALKLAKGFVATSARRPILQMVHIIADAQHQKVTFEATDAARAVTWSVDAEVSEDGDCVFEIPNYLLQFLNSKSKLPYDAQITIYEENDLLKADIDNCSLALFNKKSCHTEYPKTNGVFDVDAVDSQPKIDIHALQASLKAMANAGATAVTLKIGKDENKKFKLIANSAIHTKSMDIEVVMCPLRKY